jgi:peptidoglycan/xylan/chitin deacetylase (PgdA/CDA1 family)
MASTEPRVTLCPSTMRWPGGRHVAVIFNVAYEVWTEGKTSGVGPMGNPLPNGVFDPNADSYGNYGVNSGISRLTRILAQSKIAASIFTSGAIAERHPDQLKAVADAGHDIVAHGYGQDQIPAALTAEQDERSIERTTSLLEQVTGVRPTGWISPRATAGRDTTKRLLAHGYRWQGDFVDRDLPCLHEYPEGKIVALPLGIDFNDLSHSMRFGRTPRQFVDCFSEALQHALADKDDVVFIDVLVHTHCYGRPATAWAFAEVAKECGARDDIWVATRSQVVDHFLTQIS